MKGLERDYQRIKPVEDQINASAKRDMVEISTIADLKISNFYHRDFQIYHRALFGRYEGRSAEEFFQKMFGNLQTMVEPKMIW